MVEGIGGVKYYTVEEFAALIRMPESTVRRWIDYGYLKYWQVRPKSPIRIPATELDAHLQA